MAAKNPDYLKPFAGREAVPGWAYLVKDRVGYKDPKSKVVGVDEGKMCATFVISTDDPDRVDDVVTTKGIYLGNFRANPIAFYGHQAMILPVGKWADRESDRCTISLREHEATGTCAFSQRNKDAADVFDLVVEGILRATSIGFNPMEEPIPRDGRKANPISLQRGFVFPKVDLLEVSIVGIPAQPTATLVRAYLSGKKGVGLSEPVRKSLELMAEAKPVWSPGGFSAERTDDMSKKWGKTTPKKKAAQTPPPPKAKALPDGVLVKLLDLIPPEFKKGVEDCVSEKIPKLIAEGYPEDQAQAIAFSQCGKDLSGSNGTAGGYTVAPDDKSKGKDKDKKAVATAPVRKQPPPPKGDVGGDGEPGQDDGKDEPPMDDMADAGGGMDPKEVLNRLVDALQDYLEVTAAAKPSPVAAGGDIDEGEEDDLDLDMPDQDVEDAEGDEDEEDEDEEEEADKRYQFRDGKPEKTKSVQLCAKCMKSLCKECKAAVSGDQGEGSDSYDSPAPTMGDSVEKKDLDLAGEPDMEAVLKRLAPVLDRGNAVANAYETLQGRMPT